MLVDTTVALLIGTVLVLPWTLKHTGNWDKIKKWYSYLLGGMIIALISAMMSVYAYTSYISPQSAEYWIIVQVISTIGIIIAVIGALGIAKKLLIK